jgi:hypothetical protein
MLQTSKYFKLPAFSTPQFHIRITRWLKQKEIFSLGNVSSHCVACRAYKAKRWCARQVPLILTPAFKPICFHSLLTASHHLLFHHVWWSWLNLQTSPVISLGLALRVFLVWRAKLLPPPPWPIRLWKEKRSHCCTSTGRHRATDGDRQGHHHLPWCWLASKGVGLYPHYFGISNNRLNQHRMLQVTSDV